MIFFYISNCYIKVIFMRYFVLFLLDEILVSDFKNGSIIVIEAIKNDKKYMDFWAQLITLIKKSHDLDVFKRLLTDYIHIYINYLW